MKKLIILSIFLLVLSAALFAASARVFNQQLVLANEPDNPDDILNYVTNTGTTTSDNYILHVTANGETKGTDLGQAGQNMRVYQNTLSGQVRAIANFNQSLWTANWVVGSNLVIDIWWVDTPAGQGDGYAPYPEYKHAQKTWVVVAGSVVSQIDANAMIVPPPYVPAAHTYTYNLIVNGPAGTTVTGPGTYAGAVNTTYTCGPNNTDINDLIGNWTVPGTDWVVNPIAVTADMFVAAKTNYVYNATITFVPAPDVYNYTLHVTGPDGIAVTGPVNGTLDYDATDLDGTMENALLGVYTAGAAPVGFQWTNNPITVTAANFAPAKSAVSVLGSRNNGAKATYNYVGTIEFLMEPIPPVETWTYNLTVNGPATKSVTGPGSYNHVMPWTFNCGPNNTDINDLIGTWTADAAPAGFHWQTNPITVTADMFVAAKVDHVYNATIEFVLVENVIDPDNPPMGIVVTPGGDNGMPGTDAGQAAVIYTIAASGVWDVVVTKPAGYGYPWYAYINTTPMLASGPIMLDTYTFMNVDFGAKAPLVITLDDDESMTLPVELSYFAATLTAQNFVKLTWVSQSETGLLGYRVYRSENDNQANAVSITPSMIAATNTSTTQTYNVVDEEVVIGNTYYYWLESVDMGHSTFFGPTSVLVEGEVPPVLPEYTTMRNAYPNPFRANTNTTIEVSVKAGETGSVTVYNVLGQVVKTFSVKEGMNSLNWNGKDSKGNACGSGIYFYKLSTPSMNMTKKMVIVK